MTHILINLSLIAESLLVAVSNSKLDVDTKCHSQCCMHKSNDIYTQTTILRPSWILSETMRVSWHQKGKTNLDLLEQEIVSGSGISWAICKSAPWPRHNHASIPPLNFLQARCPSCCPTTASKHWRHEHWWIDCSIDHSITQMLIHTAYSTEFSEEPLP